jgi:hypothetical protein
MYFDKMTGCVINPKIEEMLMKHMLEMDKTDDENIDKLFKKQNEMIKHINEHKKWLKHIHKFLLEYFGKEN